MRLCGIHTIGAAGIVFLLVSRSWINLFGSNNIMNLAMTMTRAGCPEVLQPIDIKVASPGPHEVLVTQSAIGVNFVDI